MTIKISATDKQLSTNGGLLLCHKLIHQSHLTTKLTPNLPSLTSGQTRSQNKLEALLLGFASGADCLDDMDRLAHDQVYSSIVARPYTAKALGDFLRSFSILQCHEIRKSLIDYAFDCRQALFPAADKIIIDIDSTTNQQYGKKMEGIRVNHKGILSYDTIQAFDEYGLQYWQEVRPGATFSGNDSKEILDAIFSKHRNLSFKIKQKRYSRADSAFCNLEYFNTCINHNIGFIVPMRGNMLDPQLPHVREWKKQNPSKKNRILFKGGRECEIGETLYWPKDCRKMLRVIVLRAERPCDAPLFKGMKEYDYQAFVTNIGEHEMSAVKGILFYRGRGQAENFIKELKYGFDLKHYPCLKMNANQAYALIGAFAYNLMRTAAWIRNPKRPHYAKILRHVLVRLPVQIVRHARQVIFCFMNSHLEEVRSWIRRLNTLQFGSA